MRDLITRLRNRGSATSEETLRLWIGYHFCGDAEGSTVRTTLGCPLGIPPR
ncbi:hypothetical protein ACFPM7_21965 [Actinokineospora guangxiensis]|uniref:Uncharacterized protein n=1 Tax=Actinokineospora guangxiensis TaxID=1490288 RepID=A0ABW0EQN3_9PSEU